MRRFGIPVLCLLLPGCGIIASAHGADVLRTLDGIDRNAACSPIDLGHPLTLSMVVDAIVCRDPQGRVAWADIKSEAAATGIARAAYLPRLSASVDSSTGRSRIDRQLPYMSGEGTRKRQNAGLTLTWLLVDFGRREAALRNADQLLVAAQASRDSVVQARSVEAAQLYFQAQAAQHSAEASQRVVEAASRNLEAADAKYRGGAAALADRLQAETALTQARLQSTQDAGSLSSLLGTLALRMGYGPQARLQLASLDPVRMSLEARFADRIDELLQIAQRDHPQVIAAQARLQAARAGLAQSKADGRPSLSLTAGLNRSHTRQAAAYNGNTAERDNSIGLQLEIPIFDGFDRTYRIRSAQSRVEAANAQLADTQQQVTLDAWEQYQALSVQTRSTVLTRQLLEQSRQTLDVVQGRYQAGVGSMVEVLNALSAYASAQTQYNQSWSGWQIARIRLAAALGRLQHVPEAEEP
ncbi:MAG TPA: TolC family protein [Pseudomonas sp.]|uniref:TolC family protein n=1 Tax=Pseudomonas sp. TaxID=306 RepID=UPI002B47AF2B|nr:TolC family protein [Pseudomonas sp.]HKS13515.1 TolC family protein [Pseudomonas sp.]